MTILRLKQTGWCEQTMLYHATATTCACDIGSVCAIDEAMQVGSTVAADGAGPTLLGAMLEHALNIAMRGRGLADSLVAHFQSLRLLKAPTPVKISSRSHSSGGGLCKEHAEISASSTDAGFAENRREAARWRCRPGREDRSSRPICKRLCYLSSSPPSPNPR